MKGALGLAALGCVLTGVDAKAFKWSPNGNERRWEPPQATDLGVMPLLGGFSPQPTEPPQLKAAAALHKRHSTDNTCAYVSNQDDVPLYCDTNSYCIFNSINSHIGCCSDASAATECGAFTACYDSTAIPTTLVSFSTDVVYCGSSAYPYCRTHIYEDELFSGYTLFGCAKTGGTDSVDYRTASPSSSGASATAAASSANSATESLNPVIETVTVSASPSPASSSTSTSASASSSSSSSSSGDVGEAGGHKSHTGAIVGGVVGGVGGLALIGLTAFFFWRHGKKHATAAAAASPAGPAAFPPSQPTYAPQGGPGGGAPPMAQQYPAQPGGPGYAGFAPVQDNRVSSYAPTNSVYDPSQAGGISPSASPPPHSPSPGATAYSPTAAPYGAAAGAAAPQQHDPNYPSQPAHYQNPAYSQTPEGFVHELPTTKPDGEVHELS